MSYDPKLVEAMVAAAQLERRDYLICRDHVQGLGHTIVFGRSKTTAECEAFVEQRCMQAALAAIDASGTHWVAPWAAPRLSYIGAYPGEPIKQSELWAGWRDTYLAEREMDISK